MTGKPKHPETTLSERLETVRLLVNPHSHYVARLARNAEEVRSAQILRFSVFNLELQDDSGEQRER
jgi:putative hemolysin